MGRKSTQGKDKGGADGQKVREADPQDAHLVQITATPWTSAVTRREVDPKETAAWPEQ